MRLLLDTHIVLWVVTGDRRLSMAERRLIESGHNTISVSVVTIWEVKIKWSEFHGSGARKLIISPAEVRAAVHQAGWQVLALTADHAEATLDHALPHKDPFDELLMVQAQVETMRLLTRDNRLVDHPLALAA